MDVSEPQLDVFLQTEFPGRLNNQKVGWFVWHWREDGRGKTTLISPGLGFKKHYPDFPHRDDKAEIRQMKEEDISTKGTILKAKAQEARWYGTYT